MNKHYDFTVQLHCPVCGSTDIDISDDNAYGKCNTCNKEFLGGYDELVESNQSFIQDAIDAKKDEIKKDIERDLKNRLKNAFKGSKNVKIT